MFTLAGVLFVALAVVCWRTAEATCGERAVPVEPSGNVTVGDAPAGGATGGNLLWFRGLEGLAANDPEALNELVDVLKSAAEWHRSEVRVFVVVLDDVEGLDPLPLVLEPGGGARAGAVSGAPRRAGLRLRHLPGRLPMESRCREAACR